MGRWPEGPEGLNLCSSPFMGRWPEGPEGLTQTRSKSLLLLPIHGEVARRATQWVEAYRAW